MLPLFEEFINENKSNVVGTHQINRVAHRYTTDFITIVGNIMDVMDKEPSIQTLKSLKSLLSVVNHGWAKRFKNTVNDAYDDAMKTLGATPLKSKNEIGVLAAIVDIKKLINSGDIQSAKSVINSNSYQKFAGGYYDGLKNPDYKVVNPFVIGSSFFLQSTGMYDSLNREQIKRIISKPINYSSKSFLRFSVHILDDYQLMLYYIESLTNKDVVVLTDVDYRKYVDYTYMGDAKYKKFKSLVDDYLLNNKKSHIPMIIDYMDQFPEIKKLNNYYKSKKGLVYRGLGFTSASGERIPGTKSVIDHDKQSRYVACTNSPQVAKRFSQGRGHVMYDKGSDNDVQYILTYDISDPMAVVFDTRAIGGIYGESEILIDTRYSKVIDIKTNYKDGY